LIHFLFSCRKVLDKSLLSNLSLPTPDDAPLRELLRRHTPSADSPPSSRSSTPPPLTLASSGPLPLSIATNATSASSNSSSSSSSSTSSTSSAGVVVATRFQVYGEVGRGGEGVVLQAADLADHRKVVVLKRRHCNDVAELQEAMQEALMLARVSTLASPHFAAYIDSFFDEKLDGDQIFFDFTTAQEFIAGGDLLRKLSACASLQELQQLPLARWCHQLCIAVDTLHTHSIVHRDIKAENILLRNDRDLTLVLCDFGCAVMSNSRSPSASQVVGSTVYLAPELMNAARGSVRPSFAADAWAVGVVLLDLATGMLHSKDGVHKVSAVAAAAQKNAANAAKWRAHLDDCLKHLLVETSLWSTAIQSMLRLDVNLRLTVGQAAAMAQTLSQTSGADLSSGSPGDSVFDESMSPLASSSSSSTSTRRRSNTATSKADDDGLRSGSSERRQPSSKASTPAGMSRTSSSLSSRSLSNSNEPRVMERMASMPVLPASGAPDERKAPRVSRPLRMSRSRDASPKRKPDSAAEASLRSPSS
jgi:serine/threonine protein kinase